MPWEKMPKEQSQALKGRYNGGSQNISQSLVKNLIHLVYSTKSRQLWIPEDDRDGLFKYQAGILQEWDSPALLIGGVADHVHMLFSLSKNHALKKFVEEVKLRMGLNSADLFRPFRACVHWKYLSQGVALGWFVAAPSGRKSNLACS
jgi:REP element-mobilizing transposase RayT